ncbi:MAG TPA: flagellar motor switch protein FliM, partial [Phycisphaerales bacterium]|nr:flagellar motor switch protein FliM [Phycisphaerales bacterium]
MVQCHRDDQFAARKHRVPIRGGGDRDGRRLLAERIAQQITLRAPESGLCPRLSRGQSEQDNRGEEAEQACGERRHVHLCPIVVWSGGVPRKPDQPGLSCGLFPLGGGPAEDWTLFGSRKTAPRADYCGVGATCAPGGTRMADVLDQGDVDALLAAVASGEVEEEDTSGMIFSRSGRDMSTVEVRSYDFKRPERVSKDQMRALQTLHEAFARNFGAALSGFLRAIVEVRVATCEQMTYGDFISGLPNPTSFNLISADTLQGQMCLEISPLIIYPIIDRLLGGTSQELFIPQRPMTLIETRLIENVTRRGLAALSEAWESVRKLSFEITATESNPQLVQIVPPNEVVVVVGLEMKLSNRAGTMNLCTPYNVIEPVMEDLSTQ